MPPKPPAVEKHARELSAQWQERERLREAIEHHGTDLRLSIMQTQARLTGDAAEDRTLLARVTRLCGATLFHAHVASAAATLADPLRPLRP
jgi:hypothetical protein